jgi:hypothetical protein
MPWKRGHVADERLRSLARLLDGDKRCRPAQLTVYDRREMARRKCATGTDLQVLLETNRVRSVRHCTDTTRGEADDDQGSRDRQGGPHQVGARRRLSLDQTSDAAMSIPPYAAYARPANAKSTRVSANAKAMRLTTPSTAISGVT